MRSFKCLCFALALSLLLSGVCSADWYAHEDEARYVDNNATYLTPEEDAELPLISLYAMTEDDTSMLDGNQLYLMHYFYANYGDGMLNRGVVGNHLNTNYSWASSGISDEYLVAVGAPAYDGYWHSIPYASARDYFVIHAQDEVIFEKKAEVSLQFHGLISYVYNNGYVEQDGEAQTLEFDVDFVESFSLELTDINGKKIAVAPESVVLTSSDETRLDLSLKFVCPEVDIVRLALSWSYDLTEAYHSNFYDYYLDMEMYTGFYNNWTRFLGFSTDSTLNVSVIDYSKTNGLLSNIIEWLKGIRDGILNVFDSIKELPGRIVSGITDAIKGLFIPSQESIVSMKDKWDKLLADRFGVVYESATYIDNFYNAMPSSISETEEIEMPAVTVNLAGTDFSFGGFMVDLVPDRFDSIVGIVKSVISVVCTLAFINAMKNKFSKLLGGDEA